MHELIRRLRFFLHRDRFEQDLDEEMRHHLALKAEQCGSTDASRRQFGNVTRLKEKSREAWSWTFLDQLLQDVRYAWRTMKGSPLFTGMAVLSLALGIGANTAIYSFLDAILLRSLPVHNPKELVVVKWRAKAPPPVIHGLHGSRDEDTTGVFSPNYPYAAYEHLKADSNSLSSLFAYATAYRINLVTKGQAEVGNGQLVAGSFYRSLGVAPAHGRLIDDQDDRAGAEKVAVLGYRYWQTRFASDPAAVGQAIRINDVPFTIIGVSAPEFFGVNPGSQYEVYLPLRAASALSPKPLEDEKRRFLDRNFYWVEMMGRLRPGVDRTQAEIELAGKFRQYVMSTASNAREKAALPELWLMDGAGGLDSLRRFYSRPLYVLMTMVCVILAISCANIANLLLVRATARRREMAVRLSLGAARTRLIRQLLTESVLLAMSGALLGLLVAMWGIRALTLLLADANAETTLQADINWNVLLFTWLLALVTGLVFGLVPALQATKVDVTPALKETRASARTGGRSHSPISLSRTLVALQIALSLLLVVGAGLFARTLSNLQSVHLGFNQNNLLLFSVNARQAGYEAANLARFYEDLQTRFRRVPGVREAALAQFSLVSGYWNSTGLSVPGKPSIAHSKTETCILPVDVSFLRTMQIPVVLGRDFEDRDMTTADVGIVNEEFAKKFFPGESPIGRRIELGGSSQRKTVEILGVARSARYNSIKEKETPPLVYVPYTQDLAGLGGTYFTLRTSGDPLAVVPDVRRIVREASPSVPVANVSTQTGQIEQMIGQERTFQLLCTSFAVLALTIACIGLYGTMAYTVARRTSEIGIRMALGAERRSITTMVLREAVALSLIGVVAGLGLAWGTTRFVESFLFGLRHNDPLVLSFAVALLAGAAILAGYAPARHASRIDPVVALRHE